MYIYLIFLILNFISVIDVLQKSNHYHIHIAKSYIITITITKYTYAYTIKYMNLYS